MAPRESTRRTRLAPRSRPRASGSKARITFAPRRPGCQPVDRPPLIEDLLSFPELLKVDRPLLDERVPALHRLRRLVVEAERGVGELRHAGPLLGVDVERLLGERERRRALVEELGAPFLHLGAKLAERDHPVDEPHLEGFARRVLAAEVPDLPRPLLADDPGEEPGAVARVHTADAGPGLAEDGVLGRDREIADDVQHVAAADREAGDHRDDRLRDVADRAVQSLDVHRAIEGSARGSGTFGPRGVAALAPLLLVPAGAEGLVPGAGEHHD